MAWNETTREKHRRSSDRHESDLTIEEWLLIEPLLQAPSKPKRHRTVDLRAVFDAIQHMPATGCQWKAIPKCFPPLRRFRTISTHGATSAMKKPNFRQRLPDLLSSFLFSQNSINRI